MVNVPWCHDCNEPLGLCKCADQADADLQAYHDGVKLALLQRAEAAEASNASLRQQLERAVQLAEVATDWNLDEVEIDGEIVKTHSLRSEFEAALKSSEPKE